MAQMQKENYIKMLFVFCYLHSCPSVLPNWGWLEFSLALATDNTHGSQWLPYNGWMCKNPPWHTSHSLSLTDTHKHSVFLKGRLKSEREGALPKSTMLPCSSAWNGSVSYKHVVRDHAWHGTLINNSFLFPSPDTAAAAAPLSHCGVFTATSDSSTSLMTVPATMYPCAHQTAPQSVTPTSGRRLVSTSFVIAVDTVSGSSFCYTVAILL